MVTKYLPKINKYLTVFFFIIIYSSIGINYQRVCINRNVQSKSCSIFKIITSPTYYFYKNAVEVKNLIKQKSLAGMLSSTWMRYIPDLIH